MNAHPERRALALSIWVALAQGVYALVWGLVFDSRVVLLDGGYILLGVLLSWVSLRASVVIARGPSTQHPFGRESFSPLVVLLQALVMLVLLVIAALDAIAALQRGGADASAVAVVIYGAVTAAASWLAAARIRRLDPVSSLVAAEVAVWHAGAVMSAVVAAGAGAAILLDPLVGENLTRYIDPVLVLAVCVFLATVAVRLANGAIRELTEARSPAPVHDVVEEISRRTCAEFGIADPLIRETTLGHRLYLDIEALVSAGDWDVGRMDDLRHLLAERLATVELEPWIDLTLTADPALLSPPHPER